MIKNKELIRGRVTAILLWSIPWGIVVTVLMAFHNELYFDSFVLNELLGFIMFIALCYIVSSIYSFAGFVWPLINSKGTNGLCKVVTKPHSEGTYSKSAKELLKLFENDIRSERLYASCIIIHDFLLDYKERNSIKDFFCYIPSAMQMREYPFESLCMMLSSQEKLKATDTDKYYNFELVLNTCLMWNNSN